MKRRLLIAGIFIPIAIAALLLSQHRAYQRASYQGKHTREWVALLYAHNEPRGTNAPAAAFRAMGPNAVPALRSLVHLRDPFYEKALLKHARRLPPKTRSYLFRKLKPGRNIEYRIGAIRALGLIGPPAQAALPELLRALADSDSRIRWLAAQTIALLGPEAIAALIPLTTHPEVNLRHAAVYALGEARTNALPATSALIYSTLDTNQSVCASAYYSLSRIGRIAFPETVAMAVNHPEAEVRNAAFRALIVLLPPPGRVPGSHLTIATNSAAIRRLAILSLSRSRLTNDHALTLFQTALQDEDPTVRESAQRALARLDPANTNAFRPPW